MRTSNKLLSGLILTGLLLIAGLFIFVRVQVARGAVITRTMENRENYWADVHKLDGRIRSVSITGLRNIILVPADTARLEIDKGAGKGIIWKLENGVLTLGIDTSNKNHEYSNSNRVELFLPATDSITADNATIDVKNTGDSATAAAFNFILSGSTVNIQFDSRDRTNKPVTYYQSLQFDARNQSEVKLDGGLIVNKFSATLRSTLLDAEHDNIRFNGQPTIQTDNTSKIRLSGQNLRKAIITSTE